MFINTTEEVTVNKETVKGVNFFIYLGRTITHYGNDPEDLVLYAE